MYEKETNSDTSKIMKFVLKKILKKIKNCTKKNISLRDGL